MLFLSNTELFQMACKTQGKWGMLVSFDANQDLKEIQKAAPYLGPRDSESPFPSGIFNGECYLFFDTEDEMRHAYHSTVGDDGPTPLNDYNGTARVYALTCNPNGKLMSENT